MSLIRSWFDYKNQCKKNIKDSLEHQIRYEQTELKTYSLEELYINHKIVISAMAIVAVISVILSLFIYFTIGQNPGDRLFCLFLICMLLVICLAMEHMFVFELVATNRSIAIAEKYSATKRRHNIAN